MSKTQISSLLLEINLEKYDSNLPFYFSNFMSPPTFWGMKFQIFCWFSLIV